jgi:hypothetical protein
MRAEGAVITGPAMGALRLMLTIYRDGSATLTNTSDTPLIIDGYQITASRVIGGNAVGDGTMDMAGWATIMKAAVMDPGKVEAELGAGALGFFRMGYPGLDHTLAEAIPGQGMFAVFQPHAPWSIGRPFVPPPADVAMWNWYHLLLSGETRRVIEERHYRVVSDWNGLFYRVPGIGGNMYLGAIEFGLDVVPEPATLTLLGLGGWILVLRRRHGRG